MCWTCGCGELEERHDSRALTTADLQGAADQAGGDIPHAVANIVLSLSHFDPARAEKGLMDFIDSLESVVKGTVLKAREEDRFLLMVAYSPNRLPLRGADKKTDLVSPRVLEKACWRFMENGARTGMWHEDGHGNEAQCVENYIYRNPVPWDVQGDGSLVVKEGDWVFGCILSKAAWALYKEGLIGGVSMQGGARRKPASGEAIARVKGDAA